jgi:hypothetical protein
VARVHERICHRRKNFIQQETHKLIKRYGLIALEALIVRNMIKNPNLAKLRPGHEPRSQPLGEHPESDLT